MGIEAGQKREAAENSHLCEAGMGDVLTHVRHLSCHTLCTRSSGDGVCCRCSYLFISVFINNILTARINTTHHLKYKPQVFESPSLPPSLQICFNQRNSQMDFF